MKLISFKLNVKPTLAKSPFELITKSLILGTLSNMYCSCFLLNLSLILKVNLLFIISGMRVKQLSQPHWQIFISSLLSKYFKFIFSLFSFLIFLYILYCLSLSSFFATNSSHKK